MPDVLLYCLHEEDRARMARVLEDTSFNLLPVSSRDEFKMLLDSAGPILSILDYRLPEGDAMQFIRNLREDPKTRYHSYVVKIDPAEVPMDEDTSQGINDFLLVPYSDTEFLKMVERLTKVKRRRSFQALIRVSRGKEQAMGKTLNLSPTGVLLQVPIELKPGEVVEISFYLPRTRTQLRATTRVRRRASERISLIPCYGLEYMDLPAEFARKLEEFVHAT